MTAAPAIASSPIEHQAVEFLSRVLTDGYAEVRTFAEEGDTPAAKKRQRIADSLREFIRVEQGVIQEPHKLLRFLKRCETEHFNTYYGVSSRSQEGANAKKGDGNHCQVIKVLPVDLDFKYGELEARKRLADFIVAPSFTVESGDGIHAYWAISPIYLRAPKQYPLAQRLLARLADQSPSKAWRTCRCRNRPQYSVCLTHSTTNTIRRGLQSSSLARDERTMSIRISGTYSKT